MRISAGYRGVINGHKPNVAWGCTLVPSCPRHRSLRNCPCPSTMTPAPPTAAHLQGAEAEEEEGPAHPRKQPWPLAARIPGRGDAPVPISAPAQSEQAGSGREEEDGFNILVYERKVRRKK